MNLLLQTEVLKIDRQKKEVTAKNIQTGETSVFPYDKLVISTGASPIKPPFEGIGLKNVFTLRAPQDAAAIVNCIEEIDAENAVIVGGGRISLEVVDGLMAQAVDSTIVELEDQLLPNVIDPDVAAMLTKQIRKMGAVVRTGERVLKLLGDDKGNVTKVVTDKREIETDFAIVAVGVRPNVELAKDAGLELTEHGTIAVDDHLCTSDPDIYAGGDCVENTDLVTGEKTYAPLGSTANKHGRAIGTNLTGGDAAFPGVLGTSIMKTVGLNVARTGLSSAVAEKKGYKIFTSLVPGHDKSHFYPGGKDILLKLIADASDGRILGAQMIGTGDVARRLDALAGMMTFKATAAQLANLDMCYAPPFASAMDPLLHAANTILNKLDGLAVADTVYELESKLATDEDFVLLDVRAKVEVEKKVIDDKRVLNIPLEFLRAELGNVPKDKRIYVVCVLGTRAYEANALLMEKGYDSTYVEGGLTAWDNFVAK